jgi:predicted ferric reductase
LHPVIVGMTFLARIWGVRYETWKRIHWIAILVLTLVFWHSVMIGSDLLVYRWLRILWIVLWALHLLLLAGKAVHKARPGDGPTGCSRCCGRAPTPRA